MKNLHFCKNLILVYRSYNFLHSRQKLLIGHRCLYSASVLYFLLLLETIKNIYVKIVATHLYANINYCLYILFEISVLTYNTNPILIQKIF